MPWLFHNPTSLRFGEGSSSAPLKWKRVLLVTTRGMVKRGTVDVLQSQWKVQHLEVFDQVEPNPDLAALDTAAKNLKTLEPFEGIVALGGGSALDTGKILSILLGAPEGFTLRTHFHQKEPIPSETMPIPVVAIATTAGTGSEVTPFATVWDYATKKKYSLASHLMFPLEARLDPLLTHSLPWDITLSTGLDAFCQALESIWNRNASPVTLGLAYKAAALAWGVLQEGKDILTSPELRSDLMESSLLAGLAISQTRTALCHSMSYPLTMHYGLPHGFACGWTVPAVLRYNAEADDDRLVQLASLLGSASTSAFADEIGQLWRNLELPSFLKEYIPELQVIFENVPEMVTPGRSDNNLRSINQAEIKEILSQSVMTLSQ